MITNMKGYVTYNDLWAWPISSRSFSHDFAYGAQMITCMRVCVAHTDHWSWAISFRSFSHDFAIQLLKYGTSCLVCSTACTVLDGFFPYFMYLAQMISGITNDDWDVFAIYGWRSPVVTKVTQGSTGARLDFCESERWQSVAAWQGRQEQGIKPFLYSYKFLYLFLYSYKFLYFGEIVTSLSMTTNSPTTLVPEKTLRWRHNGRDSVSDHQPCDCLLYRLFRHRSKKTTKLRVTGLCVGNSPGTPVNSPHKWPVTRKMFPFDDIILIIVVITCYYNHWWWW